MHARSTVKPTMAPIISSSVSPWFFMFSTAFSFTINVSVICEVKYGVIMYIDWQTTVSSSPQMYIPRQPSMFFHSHLKRNIASLPFLKSLFCNRFLGGTERSAEKVFCVFTAVARFTKCEPRTACAAPESPPRRFLLNNTSITNYPQK